MDGRLIQALVGTRWGFGCLVKRSGCAWAAASKVALGVVRPVLQGLEVALDVGVVVRDSGPAVGLGDPELVHELGDEGRRRIPVASNDDWKAAPAIKARLAAGYCLRAPAQGACPYANICEHCPSFRTDAASVSVLAAQRVDAEALAKDAEARGWIDEADRHRRLIARLDTLLAEGQAG